MEFEIVGRHLEVTETVKDYLNGKRDKLARFFDRTHHLRAVIGQEGPNHMVEFVATLVKSDVVVARGASTDLFAAIDEAAEKLEAQLRKYKGKLRTHRTKPEEARETPGEGGEGAGETA